MAKNQNVPAGQIEPGYTTTEFWTTLLTEVIAGVVAFMALAKNVSIANVQAVVPSVALLAAAIAQFFYSRSRAAVKVAAQQAAAAVAAVPPPAAAAVAAVPPPAATGAGGS